MRTYFPELYGNDAVKERLGRAIEAGTLPHAFLLIGAEGSGKRTLTLELAAALNCEASADKSKALPCHECNSCRRIFGNNYTDITTLKRQSGKSTVGVEEVRLFREDMYLSPTESSFKIYVIEEADRLTTNAQNALLTVLEEPPRNVIILLLAESGDKILTTIKSRTQAVAMQRFEGDAMRRYLVRKNDRAALFAKADEQTLDGIIMSSDGRIGRALLLLSDKEAKENAKEREITERIIKALSKTSSYAELYSAISALPNSRVEFCEAIESVMCAIRDITLVRLAPELPLIFYTSREAALEISEGMNTKRLLSIYELMKDAQLDASRNVGIAAIVAQLGARIKLI